MDSEDRVKLFGTKVFRDCERPRKIAYLLQKNFRRVLSRRNYKMFA